MTTNQKKLKQTIQNIEKFREEKIVEKLYSLGVIIANMEDDFGSNKYIKDLKKGDFFVKTVKDLQIDSKKQTQVYKVTAIYPDEITGKLYKFKYMGLMPELTYEWYIPKFKKEKYTLYEQVPFLGSNKKIIENFYSNKEIRKDMRSFLKYRADIKKAEELQKKINQEKKKKKYVVILNPNEQDPPKLGKLMNKNRLPAG